MGNKDSAKKYCLCFILYRFKVKEVKYEYNKKRYKYDKAL